MTGKKKRRDKSCVVSYQRRAAERRHVSDIRCPSLRPACRCLCPTAVLTGIGGGRIASNRYHDAAWLLCCPFAPRRMRLCASTFLLQFSSASVLAFLITGPMIDIKNTLMMLGSFKKGFVLRLILAILLVCFLLALAASFMLDGVPAGVSLGGVFGRRLCVGRESCGRLCCSYSHVLWVCC